MYNDLESQDDPYDRIEQTEQQREREARFLPPTLPKENEDDEGTSMVGKV